MTTIQREIFSQQITATDQQKAAMGNCEDTVCVPIDWTAIQAQKHPKWTPRSVRSYLNTICRRMNQHFALIMSGPQIGSIEVTRRNRAPDQPPISVVLSIWRCQQLFNKYLELRWTENEKPKHLRIALLSLWMRGGLRKEIQPPALVPLDVLPTPSVTWLKQMLSIAGTDACPIKFNALNQRKLVYESYWEVVGRKHEWSAKRISEALYLLFPQSRPKKGERHRLRGVAVINIPNEERCREVLDNLKMTHNLQLLFWRCGHPRIAYSHGPTFCKRDYKYGQESDAGICPIIS